MESALLWRRLASDSASQLFAASRLGGLRAADGVTREHQLDAAVALAAVGGCVVGNGLRLAEALRRNCSCRYTLLHKIITDGLGALLGEALVVVVGADGVGVAFDGDLQRRIRQ